MPNSDVLTFRPMITRQVAVIFCLATPNMSDSVFVDPEQRRPDLPSYDNTPGRCGILSSDTQHV
jgi:hypothetical protein